MSNSIIVTTNTGKYFLSKNVKIFPCAYRGYYNKDDNGDTESFVFDPEARSTTEANFTNTFHKISTTKISYVLDWTPDGTPEGTGTLKCVIDGYYFEISNYSIDDFFDKTNPDNIRPYYLCIKTEEVGLGSTVERNTKEIDIERTTNIITSFESATADTYLDLATQSGVYYFSGLMLTTTVPDNATATPTGIS